VLLVRQMEYDLKWFIPDDLFFWAPLTRRDATSMPLNGGLGSLWFARIFFLFLAFFYELNLINVKLLYNYCEIHAFQKEGP